MFAGKALEPLSAAGISISELDEISDMFTAQSPLIKASTSNDYSNETQTCNLLKELRDLWKSTDDPLNERIIQLLENLCLLNNDLRKDLSNKYVRLINISKSDLSSLIDILIPITREGFHILQLSMNVLNKGYSLGIAHNAGALSDIANTATELSVMLSNSHKQHSHFEKSLEHLSQAWNTTASAISQYMLKADKMTLELTKLDPSLKSQRGSPSVASSFRSDNLSGYSLKLVPETSHASIYGVISCDNNLNIGFRALSSKSVPINNIIKIINKTSALEKVLNLNLEDLIAYYNLHEEEFQNYKSLEPLQRLNFLKKLLNSIPKELDQWSPVNEKP